MTLGIGLNVVADARTQLPERPVFPATSLALELGAAPDRAGAPRRRCSTRSSGATTPGGRPSGCAAGERFAGGVGRATGSACAACPANGDAGTRRRGRASRSASRSTSRSRSPPRVVRKRSFASETNAAAARVVSIVTRRPSAITVVEAVGRGHDERRSCRRRRVRRPLVPSQASCCGPGGSVCVPRSRTSAPACSMRTSTDRRLRERVARPSSRRGGRRRSG